MMMTRTRARARARAWTRLAAPLASALLLAAQLAGPARAQAPAVEISASAPLLAAGGDAVRARDRALKEALRLAVEQSALAAAPETRGRLYLISARARDYVTTYRVLEEGEAGGQFTIRVAAQVDLPRLLRDLRAGGVQPQGQGQGQGQARPRVLLCVEDPAGDEASAAREALSGRAAVLPASACPQKAEDKEAKDDLAAAAREHQATVAARVRTAAGAPAPIRGTQPPLFGATAQAHLTLHAGGGTTEEEAAATEFAPSPEAATQAARGAAARAALSRVLPALLGRLPEPGAEGVTVTVDGVESYARYQQLLRTLAALPGITAAEPQRFGPGPAPTATLLLRTSADAEAVAAALRRTPVSEARLEATPKGPHQLLVTLRAEAPPAATPSALPPAPAALPPPPPTLPEAP
jgi:hypothetical protein